MNLLSGILLNIGAALTFWGILWFMWDKNSRSPGWIIGGALGCLAVGWALS